MAMPKSKTVKFARCEANNVWRYRYLTLDLETRRLIEQLATNKRVGKSTFICLCEPHVQDAPKAVATALRNIHKEGYILAKIGRRHRNLPQNINDIVVQVAAFFNTPILGAAKASNFSKLNLTGIDLSSVNWKTISAPVPIW